MKIIPEENIYSFGYLLTSPGCDDVYFHFAYYSLDVEMCPDMSSLRNCEVDSINIYYFFYSFGLNYEIILLLNCPADPSNINLVIVCANIIPDKISNIQQNEY